MTLLNVKGNTTSRFSQHGHPFWVTSTINWKTHLLASSLSHFF